MAPRDEDAGANGVNPQKKNAKDAAAAPAAKLAQVIRHLVGHRSEGNVLGETHGRNQPGGRGAVSRQEEEGKKRTLHMKTLERPWQSVSPRRRTLSANEAFPQIITRTNGRATQRPPWTNSHDVASSFPSSWKPGQQPEEVEPRHVCSIPT